MERWQEINAADATEARALLRACCGSSRWVEHMMARRPFLGRDALLTAARQEWLALSAPDWLEAFADHPAIGDRASLAARFPATHQQSAHEQAGVRGAAADVLAGLAAANAAYLDRFGFIFIVCATGKTAEEMLGLLRDRMSNEPEEELRIAANEQAKITALRLAGSTPQGASL